jgi:hypothetical protein
VGNDKGFRRGLERVAAVKVVHKRVDDFTLFAPEGQIAL